MATAKGRMLNRSISTSRKLSKVSDRSVIIFTWLMPHTDDWGLMDGDANLVRAKVVPLRDYTVSDVEESLTELEKVGLIERYEVDGDTYLEIIGFDLHQYFRPDRRRVSEFPNRKGKLNDDKEYDIRNGIPVVNQADTSGKPEGTNRSLNKVKPSKTKPSKTKQIKKQPDGKPYGEFQNVFLTDEQYDRLLNHWLGGNEKALEELIFELSGYMEQSEKNAKKYSNHYATLLNWAKRKYDLSKAKQQNKGKDIEGL